MSSMQESDSEYNVFIAHFSQDVELYDTVTDLLEGQDQDENIKINCLSMHHFKPGAPIVHSISSDIEKCDITLVIVTERAKKSPWLKYEFMIGLEKSKKLDKLCVVLVLVDTELSQLQTSWHGHIHSDMIVKVDTNDENWKSIFLKDTIAKIKDMKHMLPLQVEVNLAVGQVWSHFFGYSKNVFPVLKQYIKECKWYKGNESRFPLKEFDLIPLSANSIKSLTDIHESIEDVGELGVIKAQRGSYKDREYKPHVYKIRDPEDKQEYFFVGLIPNTLSILGNEQLNISAEKSIQVDTFAITFKHLVNHPLNKDCIDMVKLIRYDDTNTDSEQRTKSGKEVAKRLLKHVKEACAAEKTKTESAKVKKDPDTQSKDYGVEDVNKHYNNSVYIGHDPEDADEADELKDFLRKEQINVVETEKPGCTELASLEKAVKAAKWIIFIFSKNSLTEFVKYKCRTVLHQSIIENELRFIPLLMSDVTEKDLPGDLKAIVCRKMSSPTFKKDIADLIKCCSIKLESKVSVKGVHSGLAWAYVLNYLEVMKENISEEQTQKLSQDFPKANIHHRLFLLIPKSCIYKPLGELDKDAEGNHLDQRFEKLSDDYKINDSKTINGIKRDYVLIPFMMTDADEKEHIVFCENINPVRCLQEMQENEMKALSGLTPELFEEEVYRFQDLLKEIIRDKGLDKQFAVVFYDDQGKGIVDVLLDLLKTKDNPGNVDI